MIDTKELRRLAQAATPGGWYVEGNYIYGCKDVTGGEEEWHPVIACADDDEPVNYEGNAAFIAAANPTAILELLNRLEAAEAEALEQAIEARVTGAQPAPNIPEGCPPHAEIYVGDGMFVWCDWKDFDLVKKYNWNLTTRNRSGCLYAQSWDCHNTSERKRITMHGLIMPAPDGQFVDHINGNGLDNRRENLRLVTHQQNSFNQKHHGGSSKFKGVSIDRSGGSWRAYITVDGKRKHLGRHGTEIDAAKAYDMAAKEFFGEYAKLNLESAPSPTTLDET